MRSPTIAPGSPLLAKRCLGISGPIDLAICQPSGRQEHLRGRQASGAFFLAPKPSGRHIAAARSIANAGSIAPWRAGVVSASGLGSGAGSVPAADAAGKGCVGLWPKQPRDLGDAAKPTPTVVVETAARRDRDPNPRID